MTERERLIEILSKTIYPKEGVDPTEAVADLLLENGAIVPPCKVGDKVWVVIIEGEFVVELEVLSITIGKTCDTITFTDKTCFTIWGKYYGDYFKCVFPTKAEAEKALKERKGE